VNPRSIGLTLWSAAALITGLVVYVVYYPSRLSLNHHLQGYVGDLSGFLLPVSAAHVLVYNLPSALWTFSLITLLHAINSPKSGFYCAFTIVFGYEIAQHQTLGIAKGVFDYADLVATLSAVLVANILAARWRSEFANADSVRR